MAFSRWHRRTRRLLQQQQQGGAIPKWLLYLLSVSPSFSNTPNINSQITPKEFKGIINDIKKFTSKPPRENDADDDDDDTEEIKQNLKVPNYPRFNVSTTVRRKSLNHTALNMRIFHLPISERVDPLGPNEKWVPKIISGIFDFNDADLQIIYAVDIPYWNIYCTGNPTFPVDYFEGYCSEDKALLKSNLGSKNVPGKIPLGRSPLYLIAFSHSLGLPDYDSINQDKWKAWACAGRKMGLNIPMLDPRMERNVKKRRGIFRNTPDRINKELVKGQILAHGIDPVKVLANAWKGSTLSCQ